LPKSVFSSNLQRHNIKCPSCALSCQSYELAQSRQRNLTSLLITFFATIHTF
jgi:hypothetical protein